ncbi:MAG: hypothetical protein PHO67_04520 [Candidatus Omnitrophica bacterium]|nr:hypothetical protein [Candidatus Omnitrophota bacterium]
MRIDTRPFWRTVIVYTEKEKKEIQAYFPKEKQKVALKETAEHVSTLVRWLSPDITLKNIKRKESVQQLQALHDHLQSLENTLQAYLQQGSHQNTIKLKQQFYSFIHPEYPQITLQTLNDLILYLKLACKEVMKNPGKPGWKDQSYHEAVENLAAVWKNHTNKEPKLQNKCYKVDEYQNSQKTCGPFLDYLNISIKSAICHANKQRRKKISLNVSLANVARDVIRCRKKSMAEISSK